MEPISEFQVHYGDRNGWQPVDEQRVRRALAGMYYDVDAVIELLRDAPDKFTASSVGGGTYRRNPDYREPA